MAQRHDLHAGVRAWVLARTAAFSLDTLKREVAESAGVSRAGLSSVLTETGLALPLEEDQFTPAWLFFRDARFLVKPQQWEIDDGILAPGHRMLPFYDPVLHPRELQLHLDAPGHGDGARRSRSTGSPGSTGGRGPAGQDSSDREDRSGSTDTPNPTDEHGSTDGRGSTSEQGPADEHGSTDGRGPIPRRTVVVPLTRAFTYYNLFGDEAVFPILLGEDKTNNRIDPKDQHNAVVRLSVFDLGDYYHHVGFRAGDYLECRLLDWEAGVFSARHCPAAEISTDRRERWLDGLEEGFYRVFDHFDGPVQIPMELQYAYFLGHAGILEEPGGTIGDLLEADNELQFARVGAQSTTIWTHPTAPDQSFVADDVAPAREGAIGDLDEILQDIGLSLDSSEIEGFMRDALFHGRTEADAVERALRGAHIGFAHTEQADAFRRELHELWESVSERYVPSRDTVAGPIRSRLLSLYDKELAFIRGLDARGVLPSELPREPINELMQFFGMIVGAIELLNRDADKEDDEEGLKDLAARIPQIETIAAEILERADAAVEDVLDEAFEADENDVVYEFRISLEGIKPQIWRRVRVPGSTTLAELHEIIQIVMGWNNAHLHAFHIYDQWFGPIGDEFDGAVPEERISLSMLELELKDRFRYIYDFGDDWVHRILVSKILDVETVPVADRTEPRVLSGKRAAPPEDCGGIPGYYRACYYANETSQERNEDPQDEEAEFWREMLPEGWDPEHVDIDYLNMLLR